MTKCKRGSEGKELRRGKRRRQEIKEAKEEPEGDRRVK